MNVTNLFQKTKICALALMFAAGCNTQADEKKECKDASSSCCEKKKEVAALSDKNMDKTVKPGDDFFEFSNGGWIKVTNIPEDRSRYGAFDQLRETNTKRLRDLVEGLAKQKHAAGSDAQKIGDFYATGMDEKKIEKAGITPIKKDLERIAKIASLKDVMNEIAVQQAYGINPLFHYYSTQDKKNSKMNVAGLWQGGLGLPEKDYYLGDNPRFKEIREKYVVHISKMLQLVGEDAKKADADAKRIMEIEIALAKISMGRLEMRDPHATYNKKSMTEIEKMMSKVDWKKVFTSLDVPAPANMIVAQPKFMAEMNKMLTSVKATDWQKFLRWNLVNSTANYLDAKMVNQNFDFYSKTLSGNDKIRPRWKRIIGATEGALGEAIGQIYVKKYFPAKAKTRMVTLVNNLKKSYAERIKKLDWMSEATKKKALAKLSSMNCKIGYPDKWEDYSDLVVKTDSYYANMLRANKFSIKKSLEEIGKPVDASKWGMTPQTVNAYYHPLMNEIAFPAAILQPPFFFLEADDAVNYGAIGVVIGHEMTHGFDDKGCQYNKEGNLENWWTKEDKETFTKRTDVLVKQFDSFVAIDSFHVDGNLTLGENIADLGGLSISYDAFKLANKNKDKIDNYTPVQRFYLSYSQVWRQKIRDKALMRQVKEDVHSPARFRVNGGLVNVDAFYQAFNIKKGDKLYIEPAKRAKVW